MLKKISILVLVLLLLPGCTLFTKNYNHIFETLEIASYNCKIKNDKDTHGGFHGDGDYYAQIECPNIDYDKLSSNWKALPLSDSLDEVTHMKQCDDKSCQNYYEKYQIPEITEGYYYFIDRHQESTNKYDDTNLNNRHSWNFTLGLLDKETNTIYYYEFDT